MIKPIETKYKGRRFRSRLEARWAIFFDECGIEWDYEPEGYVLNDGTCYLPDFYLKFGNGQRMFAEVKHENGNFAKCHEFVSTTGYSILLLSGTPELDWYTVLCKIDEDEVCESEFVFVPIIFEKSFYITGQPNGYLPWFDQSISFAARAESQRELLLDGGYEEIKMIQKGYDKIAFAVDMAKQARFEHGENK